MIYRLFNLNQQTNLFTVSKTFILASKFLSIGKYIFKLLRKITTESPKFTDYFHLNSTLFYYSDILFWT